MAPAQVAIHTGARGINTVATSACTSALHAIGYAFDQINLGRADVMISGGAESTITAMGISGFTAMKALCTDHQDQPELASRPFDATRSGFVMGEGAGFLLLEELEHARRRNATIYAEVLGFGASDDAYHMVTPLESGEGMAMCMKNALSDAGIAPDMIDIVSAHGTSTHANDAASGGVASVFAAMSLATGNVPGTANLRNPDPECDLNYMADGAKKLDPVHAIINSYGFGGTNGSLVLKKYLP